MSDENEPMFVMSMYANKTDLYEAKAKHYQAKCDELEEWKRMALKAQPHLEKLMLVTEHFENKE